MLSIILPLTFLALLVVVVAVPLAACGNARRKELTKQHDKVKQELKTVKVMKRQNSKAAAELEALSLRTAEALHRGS